MAGDFNRITDSLSTRFFSNTTSFGLDYYTAFASKNDLANNKLDIRHFNLKDLNSLQEKTRHIRLVEEAIPTCYIATNKDKKQVFRQWVFKHDQVHRIKAYFGSLFPELETNEAILEGGFTHPDYRGQSIMAKSILNIINHEENKDIKRYITYVYETNVASLKGLYKAGFRPYILRHESWFLFIRQVSYSPLYIERQKAVLS